MTVLSVFVLFVSIRVFLVVVGRLIVQGGCCVLGWFWSLCLFVFVFV